MGCRLKGEVMSPIMFAMFINDLALFLCNDINSGLRVASHYTILSLRRPAMAPTTPSPTGRRVV